MDGAPGLVTGLAGAAAGVLSAWINRGAGAGVTELRAQAAKLDEKLKDLEAKILALTTDVAKLAGLPAQVQAELEAARQKYLRLVRGEGRPAMSSQSTLPNFEELAQQLGVTELTRRIKELEDEREGERRENVALQRELTRLQTQLELLLGGKIK